MIGGSGLSGLLLPDLRFLSDARTMEQGHLRFSSESNAQALEVLNYSPRAFNNEANKVQ